jgi:hypothetical protein
MISGMLGDLLLRQRAAGHLAGAHDELASTGARERDGEIQIPEMTTRGGKAGTTMNSVDHFLDLCATITGAFAVALVDHDSGRMLGSRGGGPDFDLDVAAPGTGDVVRTQLQVMRRLGLRESIEDILISLDTQYHLIRPLHGGGGERLFLYLVLDRAQANLAMARRDLRMIGKRLALSLPAPGRRPLPVHPGILAGTGPR